MVEESGEVGKGGGGRGGRRKIDVMRDGWEKVEGKGDMGEEA